jgi:hypothetical protein
MRTNLFIYLNDYNRKIEENKKEEKIEKIKEKYIKATKNNYNIIIIFLKNMNNYHMMNYYKHVILSPSIKSFVNLDDFQDDKFIYYHCYIDEMRKFRYYQSCPNSQDISNNTIAEIPRSHLVKINKNIPQWFHKPLLYYYFIPKY